MSESNGATVEDTRFQVIIRDGKINWVGTPPAEAMSTVGIVGVVTLLTADHVAERNRAAWTRLVAGFEASGAATCFPANAGEWVREIRRDRALPGRESS